MEELLAATDARCVCGATRTRTILRADRYCTYGENVEQLDYELRRCTTCGLVRTWPPPPHEEHAPFRDDSFVGPYLAREELFEQLLMPTVEDVARLRPPPGRLVDVGANTGLIVRSASASGYTATGVELNEAAVEIARARGLDMICSPLETAGFLPDSLDVIVLSATAEHVEEIDEMFSLCRELLVPGGLLYVSNSPNIRSWGWWRERALWYGLQPTGHVWQFSPSTLRSVFERNGYRVVGARTYNLHRDFGRNKKERVRRAMFALAERAGLGDALSMAGVRA